MHLTISYPTFYLHLIRQPMYADEITIDYVYKHHTKHKKRRKKTDWLKQNRLLVKYLQASKYVKPPLHHVENSLIILYIQEFLKDILLLANEAEVDRNQTQILLMEKNFEKKNWNFLLSKDSLPNEFSRCWINQN
jgi:hypothetical protein